MEKRAKMKDDIEKGMREIVWNPEVYNDTYTEAKKAREQWEVIEHCVRGLRSGQRRHEENENARFYTIDGAVSLGRKVVPNIRKSEFSFKPG
jgi:hypothetical protein